MARKIFYIFGIIICLIFLGIAFLLIHFTTGKEGVPWIMIYSLFAVWMIFGIYRGIRHLFYPPKPSLKPTVRGVEFNPYPVSLWQVTLDFFNPLKMSFRTMGTIFIVGSLGIYTCLVGPRVQFFFWVYLFVTIALKGYLLFQTLKLARAQNELGILENDLFVEVQMKGHDVTEELINEADMTPDYIILPIKERISFCGTYEDYKNNLSNFTQEQRHILAIDTYILEVYGDSHYDFFTSHFGIVYMDAIEGLKAIGAPEYATILRRAAEKFDGINHPIYDTEDRSDIIDASDIDFDEDDEALYEIDEYSEKIQALMMEYIRKNPSKFIFKQP